MMFDTVNIKGGRWSVDISPELGANITRLSFDKENVYVPLLNQEQLAEDQFIQGSPILLPANRTANGCFTFEGKNYKLPITEPKTGANLHGLLYKENFDIVMLKSDEITLCYRNRGKIYPFYFDIIVKYFIKDDKFFQTYKITNISKGNMPLTFALHTSFIEPKIFSVPIDACHRRDEKLIPYGEYAELNDVEKTYVKGTHSRGKEIVGYYHSCGNTARIGDYLFQVSENFDHWILYNAQGKRRLLCVEPQCGQTNGLNTDKGKRVLSMGESIEFWTSISKPNKDLH